MSCAREKRGKGRGGKGEEKRGGGKKGKGGDFSTTLPPRLPNMGVKTGLKGPENNEEREEMEERKEEKRRGKRRGKGRGKGRGKRREFIIITVTSPKNFGGLRPRTPLAAGGCPPRTPPLALRARGDSPQTPPFGEKIIPPRKNPGRLRIPSLRKGAARGHFYTLYSRIKE